MSATLALHLQLAEERPEYLQFRLGLRNDSNAKLLVPRPAINCLRFGNMANGQEAPWRMQWLGSASWTGFYLESGEDKVIPYRVRPCSVPQPTDDRKSEYARCCVELPAAEYLVWMKFEVTEDYFCHDSHYRYPDLVWEALNANSQVWTGVTLSNRFNFSRGGSADSP